MNKILPRCVRTHERPYSLGQGAIHHSTQPPRWPPRCGCPGESRNRTDVANTFPKHSPRFSLFSAEEISQAISVYSKTLSDLSTYKVHVHLNPQMFFASMTSLEKIPQTVCIEILSQMFLSLTCICFVGKGGELFCGLLLSSFSAIIKEWWLQLLSEQSLFLRILGGKKRRGGLSSSQSSFWKWSLPHETST